MPRYEIYLPLKFNDGSQVPDDLFDRVRDQLISKFGGFTTWPPSAPAEGWWKSGEMLYRDDIVIYRVTLGEEEDAFFKQYKLELAALFKQEAIWIEKVEASPL